ncbi:MAG: hypothetical protein ACJAXB_002657 [Candidatus Endobugula sp.]
MKAILVYNCCVSLKSAAILITKFFRRIRNDLMEKNKTGKYFNYAVGEIILVVIGVLIALSINNWNENQIEIKQ